MRKNALASPTLWGIIIAGSVVGQLLVGCNSGSGHSHASSTIPANEQAKNDPNARGLALIDEFNGLDQGDRADWVAQNTFSLAVFETVTDPQLRNAYETQIKPLQGGR